MIATGYRIRKAGELRKLDFEGMHVKFMLEKSDELGMAAYHIDIPERTLVPKSYHKVAREVVWILAGRGIAHLNDENLPVEAGDVITVQPGVWHSFSTEDSPMRLLAVTSPYVDSKTDLYHH